MCLHLALACLSVRSEAAPTWTRGYRAPTEVDLSSVAAWNGVWVAVGERGTVLVSTNLDFPVPAQRWLPVETGTESWLRAVYHDAQTNWIAAGDRGAVLRSSDGFSWVPAATTTTADWVGLTRVGLNWILVGSRGEVAVSPNLRFWSILTVGKPGVSLTCYRQSRGIHVAAGAAGALLVSTNGTRWEDHSLPTTETVSAVIDARGRWFAAAGSTLWSGSSNALAWTSLGSVSPAPIGGLGYAEPSAIPTFLLVGANGITVLSTNFTTWTPVTLSPALTATDLSGVAYSFGNWVAVGGQGLTLRGRSERPTAAGTGGLTNWWLNLGWPQQSGAAPVDLRTLTPGLGTVLALGAPGRMLRQPALGGTWDRSDTGTLSDTAGADFGGGKWIAVGDSGSVFTSLDGLDWQALDPTYNAYSSVTGRVDSTAHLSSVAYGGTSWLAAGERGMMRLSLDKGVSWTRRTSPYGGQLYAVRRGNNLWVAVGDQQVILISADSFRWQVRNGPVPAADSTLAAAWPGQVPVAWQPCPAPGGGASTVSNGVARYFYSDRAYGNALRSVDRSDRLWVTVGDAGAILSSTNGLNWTLVTNACPESLLSVSFTPGGWLAVGENGRCFYSADGASWSPMLTHSRARLSAVAGVQGTWMAAGPDSLILQRDQPPLVSDSAEVRLLVGSCDGTQSLGNGTAGVQLSWHAESAGWLLESAGEAAGPYDAVAVTPEQEGDLFRVCLPMDATEARFYRIRN